MKRLIVFFMTVAFAMLFHGVAFAADGQVVTWTRPSPNANIVIVSIAWTAAADGTKADYTLDADSLLKDGWWLFQCVTDPGATAPADNYDITVSDTRHDLMDGALANRDTATTETALPASGVAQPVTEDLTVAWVSVTNANAVGTLYLYFSRY